MGWFRLSWIIVSAISVLSQELTTLLPQDDDACMRNEVTFTCTIRGPQNQTSLILDWRSTEYIGNRNFLRFLSIDMPGTNTTSIINGNVIAILTNNTVISGVPELVSELRVIGANQTSVVTCESVTSGRSASTAFDSSALPGRLQGGEAREVSADSCDFQVTWDLPTNIDRSDIDHYIVYVPSRNMMNVSLLTRIDLYIPNCGVGNNSIQVAAVNRLGCVGPNSSPIQLDLLEMEVVTVTVPPRFQLSTGAIVGTATMGAVAFVIIVLAVIISIGCTMYNRKVKKQQLLSEEENFEENLINLIGAIRETGSAKASYTDSSATVPLVQTLASELLELMEKISPIDIREVLKTVLDVEVTSANSIKAVLEQLTPRITSIFEPELRKADSSVTVDKLIKSAGKGDHQKHRDELIRLVKNASPETVKDLLQTLFEALSPEAQTPSLILPRKPGLGGLFQGGFKAVMNKDFLKKEGVTHIVNTAEGLGSKYTSAVEYAKKQLKVEFLELNWEDKESYEIKEDDLVQCARFIHQARTSGGSVLVHCTRGISRSTTAVVAYLMAAKRGSFDESLKFVQEKREMAKPNAAFCEKLKEFADSDALKKVQDEIGGSGASNEEDGTNQDEDIPNPTYMHTGSIDQGGDATEKEDAV